MSSPSPIYTTEALVLRLADYGEADRIVTLLSAKRGKVVAIAKGARRSRKRFGAALSIFGYGEATLRERRGHELLILESLDCARGFPHVADDLARLSYGSYACELCREFCPPAEPAPDVLGLLLSFLGYLDAVDCAPNPWALRTFELRLLSYVGLGLSFHTCAACTRELPMDEVPFDHTRGGALCLSCGAGSSERIPPALREALFAVAECPFGSFTLAVEPAKGRSLQVAGRNLLLQVIRHHLGHNLRAVEFIAKLNLMQLE